MTESTLVDDSRFVEFLQEKLKKKSQKYATLKKYGIVVIGVLVPINDVLDTIIDRRIENSNEWIVLRISFIVTTVLLLIMLSIAIFILIQASRTMDKIDMARGEV